MNNKIKLPLTVLLALGASITLGFLSFVGLMAIVPVWQLGVTAFVLSVVYESQIYGSNISSSFDKLWGKAYLKLAMSEQVLDALLANKTAVENAQLLQDIKRQRHYVATIKSYAPLDKAGKKRLAEAQAVLDQMTHFFMQILFDQNRDDSVLAREIRTLVPQAEREALQKKTQNRRKKFWMTFGFSAFAGMSCGLATVYAVFDGLIQIPALGFTAASLSVATLPMTGIFLAASVAFGAYWFMIYNAVTDIIHNETVTTWVSDMRRDIAESNGVKSIALTVALVVIISLGLGLTLATGSTWLHAAKGAANLIPILKNTGNAIKAVVVPFSAMIIYGIASFLFNAENAKESFETIQELDFSRFGNADTNPIAAAVKLIAFSISTAATGIASLVSSQARIRFSSHKATLKQAAQQVWRHLFPIKPNENAAQRYNPFRLVIRIVSIPIQIAAFLGHIASIGVSTDKVKGVPPAVVASVCTLSEGCEDLHYFTHSHDHSSDHSHDHEDDHGHEHGNLPETIIKFALSPLYALSAAWDSLCSQSNQPGQRMTWKQSFFRQLGIEAKSLPVHDAPALSNAWQKQSRLLVLGEEKERLEHSTRNSDIAAKKASVIETVYQKTQEMDELSFANGGTRYTKAIGLVLDADWRKGESQSSADVLAMHRHGIFAKKDRATRSSSALNTIIDVSNPSRNPVKLRMASPAA